MAHANAIFLSLVSGAALVLGLVPGCSHNASGGAEVALVWNVDIGSNDSSTCPVGGGDTFSIGSFTGASIVTATDGTTSNGVPVSVSCEVTQNGGSYAVNANVKYGNQGSLTLSGTINSSSGSPSTWPAQTGIQASFTDHLGLIATLSQSSGCTVTFSQNENMGIAPTRIWGYIDCPKASSSTSATTQTCDGNAQFLFENCQQ